MVKIINVMIKTPNQSSLNLLKNYWRISESIGSYVNLPQISESIGIRGYLVSDTKLKNTSDNYFIIEMAKSINQIDNGTDIAQRFHAQFSKQKRTACVACHDYRDNTDIERLKRLFFDDNQQLAKSHEQWLFNTNIHQTDIKSDDQDYQIKILTNSKQVKNFANQLGYEIAQKIDFKDLKYCFVNGFGEDYPLPDSEIYIDRYNPFQANNALELLAVCIYKDNKIISCGSVAIVDGYAYLHGDATLPYGRGLGLQKKLISIRTNLCLMHSIEPTNIYCYTELDSIANHNYLKSGYQNAGNPIIYISMNELTT